MRRFKAAVGDISSIYLFIFFVVMFLLFPHMFPSLTCGGPVLLGQGVRVVFDPQVVIVTWLGGGEGGGQQGDRPS